MPADGQAEPAAAMPATGPRFGLIERFEKPGLLVTRNTDARVLDHEANGLACSFIGDHGQAHVDRSEVGEFPGVTEEIEEHLANPDAVAKQTAGDGRIDRNSYVDILFVHIGRHHRDYVVDQYPRIERGYGQAHI